MEPHSVALADYRGKSAVLVGFFRGLHCPFCRRHIVLLSGIEETLASLNVATLGVVNTLAIAPPSTTATIPRA